MVEATAALAERGAMTEMPLPNYGYVRSSVTLHERIDNVLYNGRVGGSLDELTYADRHGGDRSAGSFICQQTQDQRCAWRYQVRYTRGVEAQGDIWDRLAELQIDKASVQKDIPAKQLEDEEIFGEDRAQLRRVGWNSGKVGN